MAQRVEILDLDSYKIKLNDSAVFTIDTGTDLGQVNITGSLSVTGNITQTEVNEVVVRDRTITVNDGENGPGISEADGERKAGIIIDRGEGGGGFNASILFDETQNNIVPGSGGLTLATFPDIDAGAFVMSDTQNKLKTLYTSGLKTFANNDLILLAEGTGIVSVRGTSDYHKQVFPYTGDDISPNASNPDKLATPGDIDALITVKTLKDYVKEYHKYNFQDRIKFNDLSSLTEVRVYDTEIDPVEDSRVEITIDTSTAAVFKDDGVTIGQLFLTDNIITSPDLIGDVIVKGSGTGVAKIDSVAQLTEQTDPASDPTDGVFLYSKPEADGGTGVFFRNAIGTQDELISRNKALLFSIIF